MTNFTAIIKKNTVLVWVLGFQFFRLFMLPFMGLMPQDAYYYLYGQNLALSYFDHPGMIGYLLRLFTDIFGKHVFVIKFTDFFITSLTLLCFYKLASYFLSKSKLYTAIILISSSLFISILSFNSTPDVPLLLFWTLSLLFLYQAIFQEKKWFWIYAGIAMGLSFNSKYTAVLLQIGLLLFLLFSKNYRKLLKSKWLWISLFISFLFSLTVLMWNYQQDFISFKFQATSRGKETLGFIEILKNFFGAIGHQALILFPVLFFVIINFTRKYISKAVFKYKLPNDQLLFLFAFFLPTFLGFLLITPMVWVKINWLMPSYITGIILASIFITKKGLKIQLLFSVFIHLIIGLQIVFYIFPIKSDDTYIGWKELAIEVEKIQNKYPNTFVFSEDNYKTSAVLDFYTDQKIYAQNIIHLRALQFDYLNDDLELLNGKNALFINSDTQFKNKNKKGSYHEAIDCYFDKVVELEPIIITIDEKEVRKFWVFYCSNYQAKK